MSGVSGMSGTVDQDAYVPNGHVAIVDDDGERLVDDNGNVLIEEV
jgi:hypothetical protein